MTAGSRSAATAAPFSRRAALLGTLSLACGREPASAPARAPSVPRYTGKLEDYVPAAGLRWLLRGSPAKLAESPSFRPALDLLLTPARLKAVAQTTGFPLEEVTRGVIARYDLGTLYLAELPQATAARARECFESRQVHDITRRTPDPNIVVLSGINEGIPVGLVTLDDRAVAYAVGDPMLWRVVEAYARGRLKAKRAFEGAALAGLESETEGTIASAYVPGPFEDRWADAAAGLLSITTALSAKLTATTPGHALLELALHGDFADSNAEERLRSTYMTVASSSTGTLLGLGSALDARTVISSANDRVALLVALPLTDMAQGARAVTSGDLTEIFSIPRATSVSPAPTSSPDLR